MLAQFGPQLWIADGPAMTAAGGFRYPTRMIVIRLPDGGLFLWSPIALSDPLRAELDHLGPVRHLIAPNSLHHLHLRDWQRAYPDSRTYAPPGLRKKRQDIRFDADLEEVSAGDWGGAIDLVIVPGNAITTEVAFFHRESATVLFTDLLQHFRPGWFTGWRSLVARLDLMTADEPSVPRKFRLAFLDRPAARAAVCRVLEWPARNVLMAHGAPVTSDAQAFLRRAFRWLVGR
jgi:hypothetical protein